VTIQLALRSIFTIWVLVTTQLTLEESSDYTAGTIWYVHYLVISDYTADCGGISPFPLHPGGVMLLFLLLLLLLLCAAELFVQNSKSDACCDTSHRSKRMSWVRGFLLCISFAHGSHL